MKLRCLVATLAATLLLGSIAAQGQQPDPPVPVGADPGGVAIAIISAGIDYRPPELATALARDGEGQMIGWDFIDRDEMPYHAATGPNLATEVLATAKAGGTPVRLVAARIDTNNLKMRAEALAYIARTPAKIVVLADWRHGPDSARLLELAASRAPHLFLIVVLGEPAKKLPVAPATATFVENTAGDILARAARHLAANPNASGIEIKAATEAK